MKESANDPLEALFVSADEIEAMIARGELLPPPTREPELTPSESALKSLYDRIWRKKKRLLDRAAEYDKELDAIKEALNKLKGGAK